MKWRVPARGPAPSAMLCASPFRCNRATVAGGVRIADHADHDWGRRLAPQSYSAESEFVSKKCANNMHSRGETPGVRHADVRLKPTGRRSGARSLLVAPSKATVKSRRDRLRC